MSYYVKRTRPARADDNLRRVVDGIKIGWTGPIRSERQAGRETAAWQDAGWTAELVKSTPAVRAEVRAWQKESARPY
jgi:hypothetical protein